MDKLKALVLGIMGAALIFSSLVYVSNEEYKEELAKVNRAKHKSMNWYGVRPGQIKEIVNN